MRRLWLVLPAFLGAACIAAAIAIPLFLVPQLRVVPLDLDITSVANTVPEDGSTGERFPAEIFDRCSVSQRKARVVDANLTQQRRSVIIEPSDRRQATVQSAQTVQIDRYRDAQGNETDPSMAAADAERKCDDGLLTANIDRVSVNRKTSVPNGTVSSLQLEAAPEAELDSSLGSALVVADALEDSEAPPSAPPAAPPSAWAPPPSPSDP